MWPLRRIPDHLVPRPTRPLSAGNERELRALCWAAVVCYGGQKDGIFSTGAFHAAIRQQYGVTRAPGGKWASNLLSELSFVRPVSGGSHWVLRG